MICSSLVRSLTAAALAVAVTLPAAAQSVVDKDKTGPVPNPVNLDTTGMFQAKFVSVGDDMFIGGQPTAPRAFHRWGDANQTRTVVVLNTRNAAMDETGSD